MFSNFGSDDPPRARAAEGKMEEEAARIPVAMSAERRESTTCWSLTLLFSFVVVMDSEEEALVVEDLMKWL